MPMVARLLRSVLQPNTKRMPQRRSQIACALRTQRAPTRSGRPTRPPTPQTASAKRIPRAQSRSLKQRQQVYLQIASARTTASAAAASGCWCRRAYIMTASAKTTPCASRALSLRRVLPPQRVIAFANQFQIAPLLSTKLSRHLRPPTVCVWRVHLAISNQAQETESTAFLV